MAAETSSSSTVPTKIDKEVSKARHLSWSISPDKKDKIIDFKGTTSGDIYNPKSNLLQVEPVKLEKTSPNTERVGLEAYENSHPKDSKEVVSPQKKESTSVNIINSPTPINIKRSGTPPPLLQIDSTKPPLIETPKGLLSPSAHSTLSPLSKRVAPPVGKTITSSAPEIAESSGARKTHAPIMRTQGKNSLDATSTMAQPKHLSMIGVSIKIDSSLEDLNTLRSWKKKESEFAKYQTGAIAPFKFISIEEEPLEFGSEGSSSTGAGGGGVGSGIGGAKAVKFVRPSMSEEMSKNYKKWYHDMHEKLETKKQECRAGRKAPGGSAVGGFPESGDGM